MRLQTTGKPKRKHQTTLLEGHIRVPTRPDPGSRGFNNARTSEGGGGDTAVASVDLNEYADMWRALSDMNVGAQ